MAIFLKKWKFLAIFCHSIGNFPEGQVQTRDIPVLGQVVSNGLELLGTGRNTRLDAELNADVKRMIELADSSKNLTVREQNHVKALELWAQG